MGFGMRNALSLGNFNNKETNMEQIFNGIMGWDFGTFIAFLLFIIIPTIVMPIGLVIALVGERR